MFTMWLREKSLTREWQYPPMKTTLRYQTGMPSQWVETEVDTTISAAGRKWLTKTYKEGICVPGRARAALEALEVRGFVEWLCSTAYDPPKSVWRMTALGNAFCRDVLKIKRR